MAQGLHLWEVLNTEGEDAPAFAVLEIVLFDAAGGWIEVRKPTQASLYECLLNTGNVLRKGKRGGAYSPFERPPYTILTDPGAGTPATGQDWGTEPGRWWLTKNPGHTKCFRAWGVSGVLAASGCGLFQLKVCDDGT
jgi:hypothetical protein